MTRLHLIFAALAAIFTILLTPMAAMATDAKATAWVNVRSGPGTGYGVVDTMAPGEVGNMTECRSNGWCYVQRSGPDGWVSSSYLTAAEPESSDPNCRVRLVIGPGGPRFVVSCDDGGSGVDVVVPGGGLAPNRVCFFDGANYTGTRFCRTVGLYNTMPAGFNNKISSVRLHGAAKVRICEFANMGPFCRVISASSTNLGSMLNNRVSSFRVATGPLPPMKQACLFDGNNFTGQHLCLRPGTHPLPPAAQNRTSSVRLHAGARIRLSKSPVYGIGGAHLLTSSTPHLPAAWNNQARSVRVE